MRAGRFDAVHVGHLDVGDDQVRSSGRADLDQLAAVSGDGDHVVAQERQDLLKVVAHVELVVGDGDLERTGHGVPLGKVMMKTAPGPFGIADRDLAAVGFDDSPGDGQSQAGSLGLGGEERVEDFRFVARGRCPGRCRARRSRSAGWPSSSAGAARISIATGAEPAARALSRRLRNTWSRRNGSPAQRRSTPSSDSLRRACLSLRACSRWAHDSRQTARRSQRDLLELDRGRVAANVFVEVVEVVLRLLEPGDQVERLGAVANLQGEHLETRLAALQGVAALVRQSGDHLRRWRPGVPTGVPAPAPA